MRVAKLESKADAVKITGEVRYHYADKDVEKVVYSGAGGLVSSGSYMGGKFFENRLRSRIWIEGVINDDWTYTGMIQNTQELDNEVGEEDIKFKRAYVEGKIGGVDVLAGRYNAYLVNGNLYDEHADGIEVSYGKDVKFTAFAIKPTEQNGTFLDVYDNGLNGCIVKEMRYGKAYGAQIDTNIGVVKANVGYTVFKDGEVYGAMKPEAGGIFSYKGDIEDNKVWNVGVNLDIAQDVSLVVDYIKSDLNRAKDSFTNARFYDDDGLVAGVNYKGAKASVPGSYGLYANYYDQARGTVIAHTMNGYYGSNGFKGYMFGANYTLAKNIVASLEWYDLESKGCDVTAGNNVGKVSKQDMETLWAQVVFTF